MKEIYKGNYDRDLQRGSTSFCFLCVSNINKGYLICIHEDDEDEYVKNGNDGYLRAIKEEKLVVLYNFKDNTFKKWNPISKIESKGEIQQVDYSSLIDVISEIQIEKNPLYLKSGKFSRFFYAVIYKLLKDGLFGINNNDISIRDFIDLMNISGFDSGQKSNLGDHLKKIGGKAPRIYVIQNDLEKSQETINRKINIFVEEIVSKYFEKSNKTPQF